MEWIPNPQDILQWAQTWWFTSNGLVVVALWVLELTHKGLTNDRGDARPLILVALSTSSLVVMLNTALVRGQWMQLMPMWETFKGPVMRICLIRYLYRCIRRSDVAAGHTIHLWMTAGLIWVAMTAIGTADMEARHNAARIIGPVKDFNFVPILNMMWVFEIAGLCTALYMWWIVPRILREAAYAIKQDRPPKYGTYTLCHWIMSWFWLVTRVVGFGVMTLFSSIAVSGKAARLWFGIVTISQLSLWWDMRNITPKALGKVWQPRRRNRGIDTNRTMARSKKRQ